MTKEFARASRFKDIHKDGWEISKTNYEDSDGIKRITDKATLTNYAGSFIRKMDAYIEGNCISTAEAIGMDDSEKAIDSFMGTVSYADKIYAKY